ncbi:MAG: Crp/Fnr family transcriptional regulator, partial [Betaproteobacteria bacterium]
MFATPHAATASAATRPAFPVHPPVTSPVTPKPARPVVVPTRRDTIAATMALITQTLAPQKRLVHAGDVIYRAGDAFDCLYIMNSGLTKIVKLTADGREQVVGVKFRGDWLGLDGIAGSAYGCDAIAMDTGEMWAVRYDALLANCARHPALLTVLHEAMSQAITRDRESLMSVCTLPADARVANFLHDWADALGARGLRTDQITLRMTRAEIG